MKVAMLEKTNSVRGLYPGGAHGPVQLLSQPGGHDEDGQGVDHVGQACRD